jgi:NADPH:quinone reductase-like Zn-dependent oxidoreductase
MLLSVAMEVKREQLRTVRWTDDAPRPLEDGQARLRVDQFALTANNVTYAVFGDAMAYWQFFPADEGWGRVPVWGFADVEESQVDGLRVGDRVYGYLPMASHLVVTPSRISESGFVDDAPHRAALPPVYNQYQRVTAGGVHDPKREREYAILRPLFMTSFLIDDWLTDDDMFGAESVVIASASSKTALGLAQLLSAKGSVEVVGLTSTGNADFVRSVGYYDRTVEYDRLGELRSATPTVFVDMAGGGVVLGDVHRHFRDALRKSCLVGATHWEDTAAPADLPGPEPTFFFAPDRVVKRRADWGSNGLEARVTEAWQAFLESVDSWLTIVERNGREELEATWLEVLEGKASPAVGYIIRM